MMEILLKYGISISVWLVLNALLAGIGILIAGGHPLSVIVGALASPFTSLNPSLAAGWFAGYTQIKMVPPTGKRCSRIHNTLRLLNILEK